MKGSLRYFAVACVAAIGIAGSPMGTAYAEPDDSAVTTVPAPPPADSAPAGTSDGFGGSDSGGSGYVPPVGAGTPPAGGSEPAPGLPAAPLPAAPAPAPIPEPVAGPAPAEPAPVTQQPAPPAPPVPPAPQAPAQQEVVEEEPAVEEEVVVEKPNETVAPTSSAPLPERQTTTTTTQDTVTPGTTESTPEPSVTEGSGSSTDSSAESSAAPPTTESAPKTTEPAETAGEESSEGGTSSGTSGDEPANTEETTRSAESSAEDTATTSTDGSTSSPEAVDENSGSNEGSAESAAPPAEVVAEQTDAVETVALPENQDVVLNKALLADEADINELALKTPEATVSEEENEFVKQALLTAVRDRDNDRGGRGDRDDDKPWKCGDDRRKGHGCQWDGWKHNGEGFPVFTNPYKDLRQLIRWIDSMGPQHMWIPPGSSLPFHLREGGVFAFAVFTVRPDGVFIQAGAGVFSGVGRDCGHGPRHGCNVPPRPAINFYALVFIPFDNRWVRRSMPIYDCGCAPVYRRDGRDHFRFFFYGHREVIGYWEETPDKRERYIVPVEYRPTAVAEKLAPVTAENLKRVLGDGSEDPLGGDPSQDVAATASESVNSGNRARPFVFTGLAVLVIGIGALGVVAVRRRSA